MYNKAFPIQCTTAYVSSFGSSRAYLYRHGSHKLFFCLRYRWAQVEWKRHWFSCNSDCFSSIALLVSVDVLSTFLLQKEKHDCSRLLTHYRWWNKYCLVAGVQSLLLFRYWIYYSAARYVVTKWCSYLTTHTFLWSASVCLTDPLFWSGYSWCDCDQCK